MQYIVHSMHTSICFFPAHGSQIILTGDEISLKTYTSEISVDQLHKGIIQSNSLYDKISPDKVIP